MRTALALVFVLALSVGVCRADDAPAPALNTTINLHTAALSAADLLAAAQDTKTAEDIPAAPVTTPFAEGSWTFQTYGSATLLNHEGELFLYHIGVGYHIWDNFSINGEAIAGALNFNASDGEDTFATGIELLLRYHFLQGDGWSIYFDGGAGIVWFGDQFPEGGTRQNFTPQAGLGATLRIYENIRLMGGARWHHVSNASKTGSDRNPGFDAAMFYLGVMVPF